MTPSAFERLVASAVHPIDLVRLFFHRNDASGDVYPDDAPNGTVDGPAPERLVVLGERGEVSLGVLTHELGLAGFAARRLAEDTGSGVAWSVIRVHSDRIRDARPTIADNADALARADTVVLLIGITDVLSMTPATRWEQHLHDAIAALRLRVPPDCLIVVAEIPPLDNAGSLLPPARVVAGARGRALNESTRHAVTEFDGVISVPFPPELVEDLWLPRSEEESYLDTYRVWGAAIADAIAQHRGQAR